MNESCFVFLLYRGICRFCAIIERFGGMAVYYFLDPPLKVMALHPRFIHISVCMCIPTIEVGGIFFETGASGYLSFSAPGAPGSPKAARAASETGPAPGRPGWGFGIAEPPDTSKELSWLQEVRNTHPRKIRYGDQA